MRPKGRKGVALNIEYLVFTTGAGIGITLVHFATNRQSDQLAFVHPCHCSNLCDALVLLPNLDLRLHLSTAPEPGRSHRSALLRNQRQLSRGLKTIKNSIQEHAAINSASSSSGEPMPESPPSSRRSAALQSSLPSITIEGIRYHTI